YITSLLFVTFVVPSNHPSLLSPTRNAAAPPFVIALQEAGISVLPHFLNAINIIYMCSVGSVSIYTSSCVLVALAEDGMTPRIFTRRIGLVALIFSGVISSGISYLNFSSTGARVFGWFTSLSGMALIFA
ncbi:hypothetical protein EV426DRAFT_530056, partial [Tirmania nivea]